jgi:hypothetical protein
MWTASILAKNKCRVKTWDGRAGGVTLDLATIPGDGVEPEVVEQALCALRTAAHAEGGAEVRVTEYPSARGYLATSRAQISRSTSLVPSFSAGQVTEMRLGDRGLESVQPPRPELRAAVHRCRLVQPVDHHHQRAVNACSGAAPLQRTAVGDRQDLATEKGDDGTAVAGQ